MGREKDVGRLQIAMNDASGVRGVERVRQRSAAFQKVGNIEGAAKEALLQRLPFKQLHDEKPAARIDPDIVHGADVRVIDAGDRSRLPFEPRFRRRLARRGLRRIFSATSRCSRLSRARYTSPIPPVPRRPRIWYGPSRVPASRDMEERLAAEYTLISPRPRRG